MSLRPLNNSAVHKILVVSLTNIGDVILTLPVIDVLKEDFPSAQIYVVIGPKAESLFKDNSYVHKVYVFDKRQSYAKTLTWLLQLRRENFDMVIDLRNTAIPFFLWPKRRTFFRMAKASRMHMKDKHLNRLRTVYPYSMTDRRALVIPPKDRAYVAELIKTRIGEGCPYIVIAPGAGDQAKAWPEERFAQIGDELIKSCRVKVVLIGDERDRETAEAIAQRMVNKPVNLCGQTDLVQSAEVLRHARLAIVNDSAPLHLASYMDVPLLALFGPTDPQKYGPWSSRNCFVKKSASCPACEVPKSGKRHVCIQTISVADVMEALKTHYQDLLEKR